MSHKLMYIVLGIIVLIGGVIAVIYQPRTTTDLEGNPVSNSKKFFEEKNIDPTLPDTLNQEIEKTTNENQEQKTGAVKQKSPAILITNGTKHIIPLEDIQSGGPPQDGIPSIDNPKFKSVTESNSYLNDEGLGIAVSMNGINRFYPNQILVWHEIVNDTINGKRILVTYCPLCGTGIVFDPVVDGKEVEFGTSGKLWNSNLIMYDRSTESYWSQVLGQAIVGERAGDKLSLLPYQNLTYFDWKKTYPTGEVLSNDTGFNRSYTRDPYGDYYSLDNNEIYFPVEHRSDLYPAKAIVYGLEINGQYKAYTKTELQKITSTSDSFADTNITIEYNNLNNTVVFTNSDNGEEIIPVFGFWFSWFSVHPNTLVFMN